MMNFRVPQFLSIVRFTISAFWLALTPTADADDRGVIHDADGFVNLRTQPSSDAAAIARVKRGEVFTFEAEPGKEWCKVKLRSGKSGWMHHSRVLFYYEMSDLPVKSEPGDELVQYGKARGIDYNAVARAAARGDGRAMKQFFGFNDVDGAAAESHYSFVLPAVLHILGDEKAAAFLKSQPISYRNEFRDGFGDMFYPFDRQRYLELHFPKTTQILYRGKTSG